jgi:hypothetical protein
VATVPRPVVCQQRDNGMTPKPNNSPTPVAGRSRLPPVRIKVWRADGRVAKVHPPDGEDENWWRRVNKALGTTCSDFVNASLFQIQAAARSPCATDVLTGPKMIVLLRVESSSFFHVPHGALIERDALVRKKDEAARRISAKPR